MLTFASFAVLSATAVTQVAAHGGVLSYAWSGQWYFGWQPYNSPTGQTTLQRPWSSYNPITDATSSTLACNDDGTSGALQLTETVSAGTPITAYWNQVWPHPYGPMLTYLAQCPGSTCTGVNANSLEWFKIDEAGLLSGTIYDGSWGAGQMIAQNSSWTTTIPTTVPSGNYLIRFETIALHSMPAVCSDRDHQRWKPCTHLCRAAYSNNDPGINIDIYSNAAQSETTYVIPGPPLYGSSSSSGGGAAPSSVAPVPSSTVGPVPSSTVAAPPSSAPSAPTTGAAQYAQCGGIGFTGPTTCESPFTCSVVNDYYSQCL
ncbi:hypothetical protein EW145_g2971 [Phellinidium pouzarii]|uniref:AA9 family lytic polysaccharide monooxygenase n=1 Tax=Phellinidium pouzarii TaxID=167371 RepID=A0A4S4L8T5_9AGAM|nr:hypothetical protein EW145_g2971 [Phellinidium pouzarii]